MQRGVDQWTRSIQGYAHSPTLELCPTHYASVSELACSCVPTLLGCILRLLLPGVVGPVLNCPRQPVLPVQLDDAPVFVGATDGNEDVWLAENLLPRR